MATPSATIPESTAVPRRWLASQFEQAGGRRAWPRRRKIVLALALVQLLIGLIAGLLYWLVPVPETRFVPLWITEYRSRHIPVNFLAHPDREALRAGGYFPRVTERAFASQERHLLLQELSSLRELGRHESVVVYLCAYAAGGHEDDVVVLPADVRPDDLQGGLPLRRLLEYLKACPARHKLLVLDIMRPLADPRLGVLANDPAARVEADLQAVDDPDRLVLVPCSPGQVSLGAEAIGRSVFGYYLEEGLRGWADGYNAKGERDGRVSVRELAEFVKGRVDRWSDRNRRTRQTPALLGSAQDFTLLALPHEHPEPRPPTPEVEPYPAWLLAGWKIRDSWFAEGATAPNLAPLPIAPRLFRQIQAVLLRAEQEWRGGVDPSRVRDELQEQLGRIQEQLAQARRAIPQPPPRSLALAAALGQKPDPAVASALRDLVIQVEEKTRTQKPDDAEKTATKLADEFLAKRKGKAYFDLAWVAFERAAAEPKPTPALVRLLVQLLRAEEPQPQYVESLFLRRLAALAEQLGPRNWPAQTVRRALEVVRLGERAACEPRLFPWVQGALEEAAQLRQEGEIRLWSPGYASLDEADQLLKKAADGYTVISSQQSALRVAQATVDEAFAFLPAYNAFLEFAPHLDAEWRTATQDAQELYEALRLPGDVAAADFRGELGEVQQKAQRLRLHLDELRRPFDADNLARLIGMGQQAEAGPALIAEIDALLSTPLLKAEDRAMLWKAGRELARRLHEATVQVDQQEDEARQLTRLQADYSHDQDRFERAEYERAQRRAQNSIALLRMGGLSAAGVQELERQLRVVEQERGASLAMLAAALQHAWTTQLHDQLESERDLHVRDQLSRIIHPFDVAPRLDDPLTNPTVQLRAQQATALWSWRADRYRYRSRELDDSGLYVDAARFYAATARPGPEQYVEITGGFPVPSLTAAQPSANIRLQLTVAAATLASPAVQVRILKPDDDWLQVTPDPSELAALESGSGKRSFALSLRIALKPGADRSGTPAPKGFLVEAVLAGRGFYYRVPVSLLSAAEQPMILFTADPKRPAVPPDELRLRPVKGRQPFYLFVQNPTEKTRNVVVELRAGDAAIPGAETKLSIPAHEVRAVVFPPAPAAASAPGTPPGSQTRLPEFKGPLEIRLLDADNKNAVLDRRRLRVNIASPREYVRPSGIRFEPRGPANDWRNRLTVRLQAAMPLADPPCQVELVLPAERIPGFIAARAGNFRGLLAADGPELQLYADNIQFQEGTEEAGIFYLTVDGVERAFVFRATFARRGAPTTPREDDRPALRARADQFVLAGPKFTVPVEVDNAPPDATLEASLGRMQDGVFVPERTQKLPQAHRHHVGFDPHGPDGALLFEAGLGDWNIELSAAGLVGQRLLLVRLLDANGRELQRVQQTIVLDDTPPERVKFVDLPKRARRDLPLTVQATGFDYESGIRQVSFFVGKPADGKAPPAAAPIRAEPYNTRTVWSAKVPWPPTAKGPTDLTVQFVNGVGQSTFETATIDVSETGADASQSGPGRIHGTVLEGDRPQPNLEVVLRDAKGAEKAKEKTGEDGTFVFNNVAPGAYKVSSSKPVSQRKGETPVMVAPGKTAEVKIDLLR